MVAFLVKIVT